MAEMEHIRNISGTYLDATTNGPRVLAFHVCTASGRGTGPCPRLPQVIFPKNLDHNAALGQPCVIRKNIPYFARSNTMGMGVTVILFHIAHRLVSYSVAKPHPHRVGLTLGFSAQPISWPKPQNPIQTHLMPPLHTKSQKRHRLAIRVKALCHTHHITMVRGLLMRCPAMCDDP